MDAAVLLRCVFASLCLMIVSGDAYARRNNPPAGVTGSVASGGNDCTGCHTGIAGSGSVQILGAPARYQLNAIYNLQVRISDGAQVGAGFQLSVEDSVGTHVGTLIASDTLNTEVNDNDPNYINHTGTGVSNSVANWSGLGNAAEYNIQWQAPAADMGLVRFWAAGNAINDNSLPSGEHVYTTSVPSAPPAAVPATSSWGMLVLALGALSAGTIVFAKRAYKPVN